MLDAYATEKSYLDHILPVWRALPPHLRGQLYVEGGAASLPRAERAVHGRPNPRSGPPVLVASAQDHWRVRQRGTIYLEHGAGQTYDGDPSVARNGSYAGGARRDGVIMFICPNERVARLNRLAYPNADAVVVGCPKLDEWHRRETRPTTPGIVAFSFHFDSEHCPETRSAWAHYRDDVPTLKLRPEFQLLGHGHPRWWPRMRGYWEKWGVPSVSDFDEVLSAASVYVVDNSSTAYEFASLGRPVVLMNAPWYRRDVEHGLRFWSHVPGRQVDGPDELDDAILEALLDPSQHAEKREMAVREAFAFTDGYASERAAEAVRGTI